MLGGRYDLGFLTYETFLNLALGSPRLLNQLGLVVLYEGQFITDPNRSITVELIFALVRREALERLWDAWERLKSLADPSDKKRSVKIILDAVTSVPSLRERMDTEATELNSIGNSHLIRHSEIGQVAVIDMDQVDYLFHRLFAMIQLMLRKK
ncbi:hypothetical protein B723_00945 [Pseudomonas fluorescens NCIMB 11764]|uniref:Uncharacterized protein n=1 Tax=Pseudomonas fluorescens NCIMB 11764 TaxID=1221522 RepID=A0A0K1QGY2_PSEFL|nr:MULTISPECIES: hypothetical protein [Pseudomonas]AKV05024.1 hypothetical protein B723_00945 [Pseudomonas fluorescens NCIMB 11764]OOL34678.1 hypothetical protein BOO94_27140 [Pseudomonas sp. FSL W5-0299]